MGNIGGRDVHVRVVSRSLVKASDASLKPHVLALSNLDRHGGAPVSLVCIYPKPPTGNFDAMVATFEATLPSLLNRFFPLAGRIATNPETNLPEVHCNNEGAELIVGQADVPLASLDLGVPEASLQKILLRCGDDVALSVQLVSFPCGSFSVGWSANGRLTDGHGLGMLASMWSELARSGALAGGRSHDRSFFWPRALDEAFTPLTGEQLVNVLPRESFVERLYHLEARDVARLRALASTGAARATLVEAVSAYVWKVFAGVVGASDARCRMGCWVSRPEYPPVMCNYVGGATGFKLKEASEEDIRRRPLSHVASMLREAAVPMARDAHFQELVNWVEQHKAARYVETAAVPLGSSTIALTSSVPFPLDTDFGFGRATVATPAPPGGRLCPGFLQVIARPGADGSWFVSASMLPWLASKLESDGELIFKPVTAECLGRTAANAPRILLSRL